MFEVLKVLSCGWIEGIKVVGKNWFLRLGRDGYNKIILKVWLNRIN